MPINLELLAKLSANDPNITEISLSGEQLDDNDLFVLCTALKNNTHVISLDLSINQISDIWPLAELINLQQLFLEGNKIYNIQSLAKLHNLKNLVLAQNDIGDIQPLADLVNLEFLILSKNKISQIQILEKLVNLIKLEL